MTHTSDPKPSEQTDDGTASAPPSPFLSVDLTGDEAARLAEGRPVITVSAAALATAKLPSDQNLRLGCPLFATTGDAFCIAETLTLAGFAGEMIVLSPRLPNPKLVEQELRAVARGFRVRLVMD